MKESMRARTMSSPCATPTTAPTRMVSAMAGTVGTPCLTSSQATSTDPKPSSAPMARSNVPEDNATTSPPASTAVTACPPRMVFHVFQSRNVSGTQKENTTKISANT